MNPWIVFIALFAVLTAIRTVLSRGLFSIQHRHIPDREALVRAKAALVCVVHMQSLLQAVDDELARRKEGK